VRGTSELVNVSSFSQINCESDENCQRLPQQAQNLYFVVATVSLFFFVRRFIFSAFFSVPPLEMFALNFSYRCFCHAAFCYNLRRFCWKCVLLVRGLQSTKQVCLVCLSPSHSAPLAGSIMRKFFFLRFHQFFTYGKISVCSTKICFSRRRSQTSLSI